MNIKIDSDVCILISIANRISLIGKALVFTRCQRFDSFIRFCGSSLVG